MAGPKLKSSEGLNLDSPELKESEGLDLSFHNQILDALMKRNIETSNKDLADARKARDRAAAMLDNLQRELAVIAARNMRPGIASPANVELPTYPDAAPGGVDSTRGTPSTADPSLNIPRQSQMTAPAPTPMGGSPANPPQMNLPPKPAGLLSQPPLQSRQGAPMNAPKLTPPNTAIDVPFEEVQGLPRGQKNMPSTQVNSPTQTNQGVPRAQIPNPSVANALAILAPRLAGPAAAAGAMMPTEVAPGTLDPQTVNEMAIRAGRKEDPDLEAQRGAVMRPESVGDIPDDSPTQTPRGAVTPVRSPARGTRGVQPVIPGRKPEDKAHFQENLAQERSMQDDLATGRSGGMQHLNITVPVPMNASPEKIAQFVKMIGGVDYGFRDDRVGQAAGNPRNDQ